MKPTFLLSCGVATALVAPSHELLVNTEAILAGHKGRPTTSSSSRSFWQSQCFQRVPAYGLLQVHDGNPGAGMHPDTIVPYQTVLKDGFLKVACVKDAMYVHGDKFGNNKFDYRVGSISNSSIVHYTDIVPQEDRSPMTPSICFEFCRGVPDMGFFGISNGRDCYCTPFYESMASDSSECDSVCEGDTTQLCGGTTKNSIFEMHSCNSAVEDLQKALKSAKAVEMYLGSACNDMKDVSETVEHASTSMQKTFGQIGDPEASNQMQLANQRAGEWLHKAEKCLVFVDSIKSLSEGASKLDEQDLKNYERRKKAEDDIKELESVAKEGTELMESQTTAWRTVQPSLGSAERQANMFLPHVLDQYYSIMYFVDKEYADDGVFPVTCDGDLIGEPALGLDAARCAAACDEKVGECVGFAAYEHYDGDKPAVLCFLYSKFKTAQYYTGCEVDTDDKPDKKDTDTKKDKDAAFLQRRNSGSVHHHNAIAAWKTHHRHTLHLNFTAQERAQCAKKRESAACSAAREHISPDGTAGNACYLTPNNKWSFADLPGYFSCLQACCQDYDPNLILDGLTCENIMSYYDQPCTQLLEVSNPPAGTTIANVCPQSCNACAEEVAPTMEEVTTAPPVLTPAPPVSTSAPVVIKCDKPPPKGASSTIKAMCRGKFSLFGSVSLKPDPEGKNKFALKELTKADRCFN